MDTLPLLLKYSTIGLPAASCQPFSCFFALQLACQISQYIALTRPHPTPAPFSQLTSMYNPAYLACQLACPDEFPTPAGEVTQALHKTLTYIHDTTKSGKR